MGHTDRSVYHPTSPELNVNHWELAYRELSTKAWSIGSLDKSLKQWSKCEETQMWGPSHSAAAAAVKSLQSCLTLCNPIDSGPPGSPVPGILQARTLEWVAISFSSVWWKVKVKSLSRVRLFTTPWTPAYQAPPSMGFSRQEYWSGVPLPSLPGYSRFSQIL